MRAIDIFIPLYEALDSLSFTEKEYELYSNCFDDLTEDKVVELRTERRSLQGALAQNTTKTKRIMCDQLPRLSSGSKAYDLAQNDLADLQTEANDIEERIKEIDHDIVLAEQAKVSKEDFLNLLKNLSQQIRNGSVAEKDALARLCVLNLKIDNEKRPHFLWKDPFATLLESKEFTYGARNGT